MGERRGVYMLSPAHAESIARLLSDPEIAAAMECTSTATEWVPAQIQARAEGRAYLFVLSDGSTILGVCGLLRAADVAPRFVVAIDPEHRGQGHARFAGERITEFAFQNLMLERIVARPDPDRPACRRVLERLGFQPDGSDREAGWTLTRNHWREAQARAALTLLHPSLQPILQAELTAGNEVAETRTGWPDADSVFVRLREGFKAKPAVLPVGVEYEELHDPHWWKAEYRSAAPRHVIAS